MKMSRVLIGSIAAAMVLSMSPVIPVLAEEGVQTESTAPAEAAGNIFTSEDGVLSIALPDDSWKEIQDPTKWIALSDGANLITLEHFSNGEKLPDITVADEHYVNTLTASFSTRNEVFVATGFVTNPEKMNKINESLLSIKILKYDTKQAVNKAAANEFMIVPRDMTMYVNVGGAALNVRSGFSVDSYIIGELATGTVVHVTGVVQRNGADYGWYQISFNNANGYVAADYLSTTAPAAPAAAPAEQTNTITVPDGEVETYLVYSGGSGRPVNITGSNGVFYDGDGNVFYEVGGGVFTDSYGAYYTTWKPDSAPDTDVIGLISDGSGRPVTIMENEDGTYTDEAGNQYYETENGGFVDDYDATYEVSGTNYDF